MDVKRAADLYAQGWTMRQIGAELGVHWSTVSEQLQKVGITIRSSGLAAHRASTEHILERGHQSPNAWAVGSRCSPTLLIKTWRLGYGRPPLIISAEPLPGLS